MKKMLTIATVCLLAAGCLIKTANHTFYLETDGTVTWSILEADVRSDETNRTERWDEEAAFLDRIREGEHAPYRVLDYLGAFSIDSRFLRRHRPYTLLTEGQFRSIDSLIRTAFEETGLPADVELDERDGWSRLLVTIDVWALEEMEEMEEPEETPFTEAFWEVLMDADEVQLLLAEGKFVDAMNFSIEDEGTRAVPEWEVDDEQIEAADGFLTYCLLWTDNADPDEREARALPLCSKALTHVPSVHSVWRN